MWPREELDGGKTDKVAGALAQLHDGGCPDSVAAMPPHEVVDPCIMVRLASHGRPTDVTRITPLQVERTRGKSASIAAQLRGG
jgi:hypothetical protein